MAFTLDQFLQACQNFFQSLVTIYFPAILDLVYNHWILWLPIMLGFISSIAYLAVDIVSLGRLGD